VCRDRADILAVVKLQAAVIDPTQAVRLVKDCVENRLQVPRRTVDDLQDFGDRLLLLQCLPSLGDQPRVLDRDHGLVGKGTDQFDLPLGERLHALARHRDRPNRLSFAQ